MGALKTNLTVAVVGAGVVLAAAGLYKVDQLARVGAGYRAKILCSEVFVAGRDPEEVNSAEFDGVDPLLGLVSAEVDRETQSVRANILGLGRREAVWRSGAGCTLTVGGRLALVAPVQAREAPVAWPSARAGAEDGVDFEAVSAALDAAFDEEAGLGARAGGVGEGGGRVGP